jgi:hypothetical protein
MALQAISKEVAMPWLAADPVIVLPAHRWCEPIRPHNSWRCGLA